LVARAVLVLYNLALIGALLFLGVRGSNSNTELVLLSFLLPVVIYFSIVVTEKITWAQRILARGLFTALKSTAFTLSLVATTIWLSSNFWNAASSSDYVLTLLFLPLPFYFWGALVRRILKGLARPRPEKEFTLSGKPAPAPSLSWEDQSRALRAAAAAPLLLEPVPAEAPVLAEVPAEQELSPVADPHRRDFLRKVGGAGIGLLAYSLLNPKQVGAAFFGSVPGPGTVAVKDTTDTKIDPAIKGYQSRTTSYGITEIDDGDPAYYGFINKDGSWYVLKEDETTGDFAYRYASPINNPTLPDFLDAWAVHDTTLDYVYFDAAFTS